MTSFRPSLRVVASDTLACDLCAAVDFHTVGECDRRGRPLETVVCRVCGLISHARRPNEEELQLYYQQQYRLQYKGEVDPSPYRVVRAWRTGRRIARRLESHAKAGDRVLEVGSGIGCTLKQFQLAGHAVHGIEPCDGFRLFSQRRLGVSATGEMLADSPAVPQYDLVLLVHVLEHVSSPLAALRKVRKLLRPGGRVYVETPNVEAPHAAPGRLFHFAHIYNFTGATLSMLAQAAGFRLRQTWGDRRDRNLMLLLEPAEGRVCKIDPQSYARTLAALSRYNACTYYLRLRYLRERIVLGAAGLGDRAFARRRMARIVQKAERFCETQRTAPSRAA